MDVVVARWIRIAMVALLAAPQLLTGAWAVLAPEQWFERFPRLDPRVVAAEPPFNQHLATDAGAGFLATGVALAVAAAWGRRQPVVLALLTYLTFGVPHVLHHTFRPADALRPGEQIVSTGSLWFGVVVAAVLLVVATRSVDVPGRMVASPSTTAPTPT